MDLDEIGRKYNCDKSSIMHDYLGFYERELASSRYNDVVILEFCQNDDNSLQMWREFFPNAHIIGVFADYWYTRFSSERISIRVGAQFDESFLRTLIEECQPNIVIDDGSHKWSDQLTCLQTVYPLLQAGSQYFIEDLHTSFLPNRYPDYGVEGEVDTLTVLKDIAGFVAGNQETGLSRENILCAQLTESLTMFRQIATLTRNERKIYNVGISDVVTQAERIFELDNGGAYLRAGGTIIDAPAALAAEWHQKSGEGQIYPPRAILACFRNVTVYGRGIIATEGGDIIHESLINTHHYDRFGPFERLGKDKKLLLTNPQPARKFKSDVPVVLLKQGWDNNYGHWLVESVSRISLVAEQFDLANICVIVASESDQITKIYRDSLELFGVDPARIISTDDNPLFFESLIYPSPLTVQPWIKAPRTVYALEKLSTKVSQSTPSSSLVYVSRNTVPVRHLLNESEIIDLVTSKGGVVVHPEALSFHDQICAFKDAKIVIGNLGAALTNVVFAPTGVTLFALTTEFMQDDFFWDLISHKTGQYISLHGKATDPSRGMQSDFTIDVDKFGEILSKLT